LNSKKSRLAIFDNGSSLGRTSLGSLEVQSHDKSTGPSFVLSTGPSFVLLQTQSLQIDLSSLFLCFVFAVLHTTLQSIMETSLPSTTNLLVVSQSFDMVAADMNLSTIAFTKGMERVVHSNSILLELLDTLTELEKGIWSWSKPKMTVAKMHAKQLLHMGSCNKVHLAKAAQGSRIAAHANAQRKKKVLNTLVECVVLDVNLQPGFPKHPLSTMVRKKLHRCSVNGKVVGHHRVGVEQTKQHVVDFCDGEKGFPCNDGEPMDSMVAAFSNLDWNHSIDPVVMQESDPDSDDDENSDDSDWN